MGANEVVVPMTQTRSAGQSRALRLVSALRFRRCSHCLCNEHSYSHPNDVVCKELEHPRRPRRKQFRDFGMDIVLALTSRKITVWIIRQTWHGRPRSPFWWGTVVSTKRSPRVGSVFTHAQFFSRRTRLFCNNARGGSMRLVIVPQSTVSFVADPKTSIYKMNALNKNDTGGR